MSEVRSQKCRDSNSGLPFEKLQCNLWALISHLNCRWMRPFDSSQGKSTNESCRSNRLPIDWKSSWSNCCWRHCGGGTITSNRFHFGFKKKDPFFKGSSENFLKIKCLQGRGSRGVKGTERWKTVTKILGRGGGQVVSVLAFYCVDQSSNPAEY